MSETNSTTSKSLDELDELILDWAIARDLLSIDNAKSQMLKVIEEIGETARAINKNDVDQMIDGLGDSFVTLIILSYQLGFTPKQCLSSAYKEIANRKGKTVNGTFIKE